jgi:hypothetical protein
MNQTAIVNFLGLMTATILSVGIGAVKNPERMAGTGNLILTPVQVENPQIKPQITNQTEPITASVVSNTIALRSGPSSIFPIINKYAQDTRVVVLGTTNGNEWLQVSTADKKVGWMYASLLSLNGNPFAVKLVDVPKSLLIHGRVMDSDGLPVPLIVIAVSSTTNKEAKTEVITDIRGGFFAYIPENFNQDKFNVEIVGAACMSPIMGIDCRMKNYILPTSQTTIPNANSLKFVVEKYEPENVY